MGLSLCSASEVTAALRFYYVSSLVVFFSSNTWITGTQEFFSSADAKIYTVRHVVC